MALPARGWHVVDSQLWQIVESQNTGGGKQDTGKLLKQGGRACCAYQEVHAPSQAAHGSACERMVCCRLWRAREPVSCSCSTGPGDGVLEVVETKVLLSC